MNKVLSLILLVFISTISFAQKEWTIYKSINGVNIYTKDANCFFKDGSNMNQNVILFKLENTNNKEITIEWDLRVWYNDKEAINNVASGENHIKFTIRANSILQGDCSLKVRNLYLYKKYLDFEKSQEMTKFVLENLRTS